jgi:HPt (histidine-containing phosphotransfer) domain-containing protein
MSADGYKVKVAKDLEDLIPTYLENRRKELGALRDALASADFEKLRQLGHRMRGVGNSYGFERVTLIGKDIEDGARSQNRSALEAHIAAYGEYLSRLQVSYE